MIARPPIVYAEMSPIEKIALLLQAAGDIASELHGVDYGDLGDEIVSDAITLIAAIDLSRKEPRHRTEDRQYGYGLALVDMIDALSNAWDDACDVGGSLTDAILAELKDEERWYDGREFDGLARLPDGSCAARIANVVDAENGDLL